MVKRPTVLTPKIVNQEIGEVGRSSPAAKERRELTQKAAMAGVPIDLLHELPSFTRKFKEKLKIVVENLPNLLPDTPKDRFGIIEKIKKLDPQQLDALRAFFASSALDPYPSKKPREVSIQPLLHPEKTTFLDSMKKRFRRMIKGAADWL